MDRYEKQYTDALRFIDERDNFLITTHINADGDAYGSTLATAYWLQALGKRSTVVFHDSPREEKYRFLRGWGDIIDCQQGAASQFDAAIVLDVPNRKRIGDAADLLPPAAHCLKIDHHPEEEHFADFRLVDTGASSTCQLIYEIVCRSSVAFDTELATLIFSGLIYDTGRFSFSNTRSRDFEIAAQLTAYGVRPNEVATWLFFSNSYQTMKIIGYGLANMESFLDGRINVIYLPHEIVAQAGQADLDELANYSSAVRGGEVGLFMREIDGEHLKISFRSRGRVDVNRVARQFGGGGHVHAAGCRCRLQGKPDDIKMRIVAEIAKQLDT